LADGSILVAGRFASVRGQPRPGFAKLYPNGSPDLAFEPGTGPDGSVSHIVVQPNGRILVAGGFTTFDGIPRNGIVRLKSNGAVDLDFDPGSGADGRIEALVVESSGDIIVGGDFTVFNGTPCHGLVRLAPYVMAPDLVISNLTAERTGLHSVEVNFTVRNAGFAPAPLNKVAVKAMASYNRTFGDPGDMAVGSVTLGSAATDVLAPGEILRGVLSVSLGIELDSYPFLLLKVDSGSILAEGNETNNVATFTTATLPPLSPPLYEPALNAGSFRVKVLTLPQGRYVLEYKDALENETWTPLPEILGTTGELILTDDNPGASQRFYRVRVQ
jgi:hypothetical protein